MTNEIKILTDMIDKQHRFVFIDLGAMGGLPRKWLPLVPYMDVIGFEPDPREFDILVNKDNTNIRYFNYALSDQSADLTYYITKGHGKSSIYKPNMGILGCYKDVERFHIVKEEKLDSSRVKSLDFLFEENLVNDLDFMKLDTQGSELLILKGGQEKAIPKVFGIQVETEFIEMYKGQPLFRHVDEFLDAKGFALIDLRRQYWKRKDYYQYRGKGQLIFGDALYFKKIDLFCNEISMIKDEEYARAKALKGIIICLVYGVFDYAVGLATSCAEHNYLDADDCGKAISIIKRLSRDGIPLGTHLGRIYGPISRILKRFKPPSYLGWADSDPGIGNVPDA